MSKVTFFDRNIVLRKAKFIIYRHYLMQDKKALYISYNSVNDTLKDFVSCN